MVPETALGGPIDCLLVWGQVPVCSVTSWDCGYDERANAVDEAQGQDISVAAVPGG